jgi:membrane-associated phospholipid phosphatase
MSTSNSAAPRTFGPAIVFAAVSTVVQRIPANLLRWILALVQPPRARSPRWPVGAWLAMALTIAAIVGSMFFVDTAASDWALHLPPTLVAFADQITDFGRSGWFLYPIGFVLLAVAAVMAPSLRRRTQGTLAMLAARLGFLFIAIGLPGLFGTIVKRLIGRARPYVGGHDDPFAYMPFIWRPEYASMPSGHATAATAAAIAIGALWPRSRIVMWLYAAIIMLTRVAINVHHPSDVIAGAFVGIVGALLVRRFFAARCLVFDPADLQAYRWPSYRRVATAVRDVVARS